MSSAPTPEPEPEFPSGENSFEQREKPAPTSPVKNMRRFFRFRIKTLGLITGAIAGISWFISLPFHEEANNEAVWNRVQKKNGTVWKTLKTTKDGFRYIFKTVKPVTDVDFNNLLCTDEDVASLQLHNAQDLKTLKLGGTNITDVSISTIANIRNLQSLEIGQTPITNEGVKGLLEMPQLQSLFMVDMPRITDEGLRHLATHPGLTHLTIGGPGITDTGLQYLKEASHLKTIFITRCNATEKGVELLQEALPHCNVSRLVDIRYMEDAGKLPTNPNQ